MSDDSDFLNELEKTSEEILEKERVRRRLLRLRSKTFTVKEIADLLDKSQGTIFQKLHRGEIPSIKIGHHRLIPVDQLEDLINKQEVEMEEAMGRLMSNGKENDEE